MLLKPIGDRMPANVVRKMGFQLVFCATPMGAEPLAVYESIPSGFQPGAWAITEKRNEGRAFFVGIPSSVVLDKIPELFLDMVDLGLSGSNFKIPWDIYGLTEDCELIAGQDFILCVNLSEKTVEVLASYRGVTLPQSIEPFSEGIKVEGSDGKIFLRLILRPFEPAGAKLITK